MPRVQPAPTARHRPRSTLLAVLAVVAALVGVLGCRAPAAASAGAPPSVAAPAAHAPHEGLRGDVSLHPPGEPAGDTLRALGRADGRLPDGVTAFDDTQPAVANLDPALLRALRKAATDAAGDGVTLYVNSGWRSPAYQDQLLREAVAKYGSAAEAGRWVATADTSPHVQGDAIDVGRWNATAWLSEHGAEYGLCQTYANEMWHFELAAKPGGSCPRPVADASAG